MSREKQSDISIALIASNRTILSRETPNVYQKIKPSEREAKNLTASDRTILSRETPNVTPKKQPEKREVKNT
ncbi:MAG: hypothetical protein UH734_01045 [Ruminococcus sp.]|nr:hypothetical protein [Ruminococcus sp.]